MLLLKIISVDRYCEHHFIDRKPRLREMKEFVPGAEEGRSPGLEPRSA